MKSTCKQSKTDVEYVSRKSLVRTYASLMRILSASLEIRTKWILNTSHSSAIFHSIFVKDWHLSKEDLSKLLSEICLSVESLRKLCAWMKACGIKTPGSRSVFANADQITPISPMFTEAKLYLQHMVSNSKYEYCHGYIEKETEVVSAIMSSHWFNFI